MKKDASEETESDEDDNDDVVNDNKNENTSGPITKVADEEPLKEITNTQNGKEENYDFFDSFDWREKSVT